MTRTEVVKLLRTSDVVKFSDESKDEDAEDFLQSLDEEVIDWQTSRYYARCRRCCAAARAVGGV